MGYPGLTPLKPLRPRERDSRWYNGSHGQNHKCGDRFAVTSRDDNTVTPE